jgi:ribosomal peptide maturation radical SAM protein 1
VEAVAEQVLAASPSIVGISTTFQQTCAALAIARRVKALAPEITICLGGANCDEPMGSALAARFPQIDVVFAGESDGTFPDFVEQHVARRGSRDVPRPASGRLHVLAPGPASNVVVGGAITALDELPIPDMDDFFADLDAQPFRERVRPAVVFESSRGCWWGAKHHCTFCGLNANGMAFRAKSAGRVLDEIDYLARRHGVDLFEAADNILNPKFIAGVLDKLVAREPAVSMFFEVKSNMTHDQLCRAARAGVTYVQPGVESLSDTILKLMEKGVTAAQNLAFLRSCREIGIVPCWNMLYRFPGETAECYEEMRRLIPLIEHLDAPMTVSSVRLDRYSPYFERSGDYGYRNVAPFDSYARVFGVDARSAAEIAYFFTGDCPDIVPHDEMQAFFADVGRWKAKHRDPAAAPLLNMIESDGESMVIDTRDRRLRHDDARRIRHAGAEGVPPAGPRRPDLRAPRRRAAGRRGGGGPADRTWIHRHDRGRRRVDRVRVRVAGPLGAAAAVPLRRARLGHDNRRFAAAGGGRRAVTRTAGRLHADDTGTRRASSAFMLPWTVDTPRNFAASAACVNWLGLLGWAAGVDEADPANPGLASAVASHLGRNDEVATGLVRFVRGACTRDELIKRVVRICHGRGGEPGDLIGDATQALVGELQRMEVTHGPAVRARCGQALAALQTRVEELARGLDPIDDFVAVTREPCLIEIAAAPCLFLPPPQEGRHGVFLPLTPAAAVHLYFGFPLEADPLRYGIDRQFLCFGAWHYALTGFMRSRWPPVEAALRQMTDIEAGFAHSVRRGHERPWPAAVEEHFKMALRCHVAEQGGGRRAHFRVLAEAFGLPHFDWFASWMDRAREAGGPLRDHLAGLADTLLESVQSGELNSRRCAVPDTINLTLITQPRESLRIVVPDAWAAALVRQVQDCWSELSAPVVPYAVWSASSDAARSPAIVLGTPDDNPLVAEVLERRAMTLPEEPTAALVVVQPAENDGAPWYLAVASRRPERAASLTLEIAVRLTCSYAVVGPDGSVLASDGITGGL